MPTSIVQIQSPYGAGAGGGGGTVQVVNSNPTSSPSPGESNLRIVSGTGVLWVYDGSVWHSYNPSN